MSRNLVVCCDGTANEISTDPTNVLKLTYTLVKDADQQLVYYQPGLGTMEAPGALTPTARRMTRLLGKAIGYGIESNVRDAYVFVTRNFSQGDRLFLFGFSRGAYIVHIVGSLLHIYGLIPKENEGLVPYAIRMLNALDPVGGGKPEQREAAWRATQLLRDTFISSPCEPWFVGVWDTVSSVGWMRNRLSLPHSASVPHYQIGRHALSIDERRSFFKPLIWKPSADEEVKGDLRQVWFPGVHSDIGGGYPEAESRLSKCSLEWMLTEAETAGLIIDLKKRDFVLGELGGGMVSPDPTAPSHESLTKWWWLAELIPKQHYNWTQKKLSYHVNLGRRRVIPPHSLVHSSAYHRSASEIDRLPTDAIPVDAIEVTPSEIAVLGHDDYVNSAAFSPNGSRIVTASSDKTARIWDAASAKEIAVLRGPSSVYSLVISAAFSPDGSRIVTASWDTTARIWDAASAKEIAVLRSHDAVRSAAFSPDGSRIVTATGGLPFASSGDKTARIWDAASAKEIAVLRGHDAFVQSAAFSPDGSRIVTASGDTTARIWDAASAKEIAVVRGHDDLVTSAAFSPDGSRIVTASYDKTARIWDAATAKFRIGR